MDSSREDRPPTRELTKLEALLERFELSPSPRRAAAVARQYAKDGLLDDAFRWIRWARSSYPASGRIERMYRRVRVWKAKEALRRARLSEEQCPGPAATAEICDLLRICGRRRKALRQARRAAREHPDSWELQQVLGKLLYERFEETRAIADANAAIEHLERTRELNVEGHGASLLLALLLAKLRRHADALPVLDDILERFPDNVRARGLRSYVVNALSNRKQRGTDNKDIAPKARVRREEGLSLSRIMALPGAVGAFLLDSEGEVCDSVVRENEVFEFSTPVELLESMAAACNLDAHRTGIGEVSSCTFSGPDWAVRYQTDWDTTFLAFFVGESSLRSVTEGVESLQREQGSRTEGPASDHFDAVAHPGSSKKPRFRSFAGTQGS